MEHLHPRGTRVIALKKSTDAERGQRCFQSYVRHLPTSDETAMFDRSCCNCVCDCVESVMGFCEPEESAEFMRQCPEFERHLMHGGVQRARLNALRFVLHKLLYEGKVSTSSVRSTR